MVTKSSKGDTGASSSAAQNAHDEWLDKVDTSHIKPLKEDWDKHAFWAEDKDIKDKTTEAGKIAEEMSSGLTPDERAESAKARRRTVNFASSVSMSRVCVENSVQCMNPS